MKDNIFTYFYKGIALSIYKLTGQKDKIKELYVQEENEINLNNNPFNQEEDLIKAAKKEMLDLPRKHYKYRAKNKQGKMIESTFDAYNIEQAKKFLQNEGLTLYSIQERGKLDIDINIGSPLPIVDLSFGLTQLSTYIKSGISLVDSFRILAKQTTNARKRKIYEQVIYDLLAGENLSVAFEKQKNVFPPLLINMVKASELTGDLPQVLDDMAEYYTAIEKTKKEMKAAMTYPVFVFVFAIAVVIFVMLYIVPQYESMFAGYGMELPGITVAILNISAFLKEYLLTILLFIAIFAVIMIYLYKKVKTFRSSIQTITLKLPIVGKIKQYSEISMFTKTFASLLNHGVFITDSMDVLVNVTNNEVYKKIITNTIRTLNAGGKISESFKDQWAIPVVAYEMIATGETTGQLGLMMEKVYQYYDSQHSNMTSQIKSLLEPIVIIFLAVTVGVILLSIILPMFEMYQGIS